MPPLSDQTFAILNLLRIDGASYYMTRVYPEALATGAELGMSVSGYDIDELGTVLRLNIFGFSPVTVRGYTVKLEDTFGAIAVRRADGALLLVLEPANSEIVADAVEALITPAKETPA